MSRSEDGVPFLMRDDTLRRTTDVGKVFPSRQHDDASSFNWTDLRALNAGQWFLEVHSLILSPCPLERAPSLLHLPCDACSLFCLIRSLTRHLYLRPHTVAGQVRSIIFVLLSLWLDRSYIDDSPFPQRVSKTPFIIKASGVSRHPDPNTATH